MDRPVIPLANSDTKPFWDGCLEGKLLLQRCSKCGAYRHPPSPACANCLSEECEWVPSTGQGTVYTFTVVRENRARGWDKMVPYVLAVIELDEGVRMLTNLVDIAPEAVTIGMPAVATFAELDGTTKLPLFKPREPRA